MAWQTPKTDWTGSDGVRDSDFNRIEGNILDLYNTSKQQSNVTIYVSTSGIDGENRGTAAAPYRTIGYAISTVPKNLNGKTVTIQIEGGIYTEGIMINGFNAPIILAGTYGQTATVDSITIDGCVCIVHNLRLSTSSNATNGVTVTNGGSLISNSQITTDGNIECVKVTNCSSVYINAQLTIRSATIYGILVNNCSRLYALSISGSDNETAILASNGGQVSFGAISVSGSGVDYVTSNGGRIYTGAQANMLSY